MLDDADLVSFLDLSGEAVALLRVTAGRAAPVVVHVNSAFTTLVGETAAGLSGRGMRALRQMLAPHSALDRLAAALSAGERWTAPVDAVLTGRALAARGIGRPGRPDHYLLFLTPAGRAGPGEAEPPPPTGLTRDCPYALSIDPDGRLRLAWADPRIAELTGYGIAELMEDGIVPLVIPEDRQILRRRNLAVLAGRASVERYRLCCRDGSIRTVRDQAAPEWSADGAAVLRVVGALSDVTDEDDANRALARRLTALAVMAGGGQGLMVDVGGRLRRFPMPNGDGAEDSGWTADSLSARLPPPAVDRWLDRIEEAVDAERPIVAALPWAEGEAVATHQVLLAGVDAERAVALVRPAEPAALAAPVAGLNEAPGAGFLPALDPGWFEAAMHDVSDGVGILDRDGVVLWLSRTAAEILDCEPTVAVGLKVAELLRRQVEPPEPALERLPGPEGQRRSPVELVVRRRSGELVPIEVAVTPLDAAGARGLVLTVRDITARRQTDETLKSLAYHDPLTGLPNRLLFHDRLTQAIERAKRNKQALTVMQVDLDRFRLINDSLGLEKGDLVLKGVAERLAASLRRSDTVARLGADEFLILLLATGGAEAAAKVAQKMIEGLGPPITVGGHEVPVDASLGIAMFPHDGDDADTLLKNAVTALSRAKDQGRNTYQFYTDDMNAKAFERLHLQSGLRKALESREFQVFYQPKVSLADGRITGVEALIRWFHPELAMVPPAEFIPLAEETGLIVPIGEWVLRTACAEVHRWHRMGFGGLNLAVNLSARQFQQKGLTETIAQIVRQAGIDPARLEFELTESVVMRDPADTAKRLTELTELGIRLSIDDFGTGYSSLSYLNSFPIRTLKIDRSFVRDMASAAKSATLVEALVAMGAKLGLNVVAEGVETEAQLALLRAQGCQEFQGYLFSRPLPADDMLKLLREGRRQAL